MNVLLTGITGNLGFEIAHSLRKHGIDFLPIVRKKSSLEDLGLVFNESIEADLTKRNIKVNKGKIDCIIHSAGNVQFKESNNDNSEMMCSVIGIAKDLNVPIYYVSTAFLWSGIYKNAYERDKHNSEKILSESGVLHTIFRPSVLVGNSETGMLRNWSAYYQLVNIFLEVAALAKSKGRVVRFPILSGNSNMVPVDIAASMIVETVISKELSKLIYITNPKPPNAQWVLDKTLEFFKISDRFDLINMDFGDYKSIPKTKEEEILYNTGKHFSPYWALSHNFTDSACSENLITKEYLYKTLEVFASRNQIRNI